MPIQDKLPKSRITLTYRTNISGKEQEVDLPFRVVVLGDFSLGTSQKDRKTADGKEIDLEDRKLRSVTGANLDKLMQDMDMTLELNVPDKVAAGGDATMPVKLPITSMKSFHPDEIARHVPKLRALKLLRNLLEGMQSTIDNQKALRQTIYDLYEKPEELEKLKKSDQLKAFETLLLPETTEAQPGTAPGTGTAPEPPKTP